MTIEEGKFYFIKDEFFDIFKSYGLMTNKENGNKRPCYFCFKDDTHENIIWFVPISSKVEKYQKIYHNKLKKQSQVFNFVFGKVLKQDRVFLIQNIFPTTDNFIVKKYQNHDKDVEISTKLKEQVIKTSKEVIEMYYKGIHIPFYDINKMKEILIHDYIKN